MDRPQTLALIPGTSPTRSATELMAATMDTVPTVIGRIVLMAAMLDRTNRKYVHPLNLPNLRDTAANRLMEETHLRLVLAWLDTNLEERVYDLKGFLSGFGEEGSEVGWVIRRLGKYEDLLPIRTAVTVRKHFLHEMELSLQLAFAQCSDPSSLPQYARQPLGGNLRTWLRHCWT